MIRIFRKNPGFLFSGLVGIIIGMLFQEYILGIWQRLKTILYNIRGNAIVAETAYTDIRSMDTRTEVAGLKVGKWHADWVVIAGSNAEPYAPHNVVCQYDQNPVVLPPDLQ